MTDKGGLKMDKLEKVLNYVSKEEEKYYNFCHMAMEKGNTTAYLIHQAEGSAFQRVRYFIEDLMNN